MLHPHIRKFLSNIGKKGGKNNAATHDMAAIGRIGGLKKAENRRKGLSTDKLDKKRS